MPVKDTMQVSEIMTDDVRVLSPNDSILKAACKMRVNRPGFTGGRFVLSHAAIAGSSSMA